MAEDGADAVIAHSGVTTKGSIGATTATILKEAPAKAQGLCNAAKSINPDVIKRHHGGPIAMPDDAQGVYGFYGASGMEPLHTEIAISDRMQKFRLFGFRCQGPKSTTG